MKIYDRLYKEMKFPPIIMELFNCPGLLRLRDVRMANNQFVAFPAFANSSRYEHSLGVCYLAGICAKNLELSEKDTVELMMACLYHDVGTPPFAHAMEEVLQVKFGFDHEQNLKNLIMGTTGNFDGEFAQIYQGQGLKILSVCQSKEARRLGVDLHRIAKLAAGDSEEILSDLVNSKGMDLDNIDNIFRASSAMGILSEECGELAKMLANSFMIRNREIWINGIYLEQIHKWQIIRDLQYTAIFDSIDDFAYQTMIKKAVNMLLEDDENTIQFDVNAWRLTDSEMTYEVLLKHTKSREIMQRVLLCKPYTCLGILYVKGNGIVKFINKNLKKIEEIVGQYYIDFMGITEKKVKSINLPPVIANFYPDKRKRKIANKIYFWDEEKECKESKNYSEGALLGFFSPFNNSNYKSIQVGEKTYRRNISFRKQELENVCILLKRNLLSSFEISLYGGESDGKINTDFKSNQLGFF